MSNIIIIIIIERNTFKQSLIFNCISKMNIILKDQLFTIVSFTFQKTKTLIILLANENYIHVGHRQKLIPLKALLYPEEDLL